MRHREHLILAEAVGRLTDWTHYIIHGSSGDEDIDKVIANKHTQNLHKLNPMPAYGSQP